MNQILTSLKNLYFPLKMRILVIILLPVLLYPIIIIYFNKYQDILIKSGIKIVIYANHMLRASYPAMVDVAKKILLPTAKVDLK